MAKPCCVIFLLIYLASTVSAQVHEENMLGVMDVVDSILERNPNVLVQDHQVSVRRGTYRSATSQFDPRFQLSLSQSRDNSPLSLANRAALGQSSLTTDLTTYRISLDKPFRWGMTLSPGIEMIRNNNKTIPAAPTLNQARVNLRMIQPLLKGRGTVATAARETVASLEYRAAQLDFIHTAGKEISSGVSAYWNYLAAYKNLSIIQEAENRAWTLVTEIQQLIDLDEVPLAEITQLEANLAAKTTTRIRADQAYIESRYTLGQIMGMPFEQIANLGRPADVFPTMDISFLPDAGHLASYIELALRSRSDYLSADLRQRAAVRQYTAAQHNRLPDFDLTIDAGYATLEEGTQLSNLLTGLTGNRTGLNISAMLSYEWPVLNNDANGLVEQREAVLAQQGVQITDLRRRISSNVVVAFNALRNRAIELQYAQNAVRLYQTSIESEKEKFRLGMSTLLNVINLEDRLHSARLDEVASQLGYVTALIRLRFELGLLVSSDQSRIEITQEDITTIPIVP